VKAARVAVSNVSNQAGNPSNSSSSHTNVAPVNGVPSQKKRVRPVKTADKNKSTTGSMVVTDSANQCDNSTNQAGSKGGREAVIDPLLEAYGLSTEDTLAEALGLSTTTLTL
jgi:hypothetical protein